MNAFAREGLCEKAEEIFEQMQEAGLEPDVYAYNALMEAYRLICNIFLWNAFIESTVYGSSTRPYDLDQQRPACFSHHVSTAVRM